jgi:hypothetical protein
VLTDGLAQVTSPGRLQLIGVAPTVLIDSAHNPHGARALVAALGDSFDFDEWGIVLGAFADKDIAGIVATVAPAATQVFVTAPDSERAADPDALADLVEAAGIPVTVHPTSQTRPKPRANGQRARTDARSSSRAASCWRARRCNSPRTATGRPGGARERTQRRARGAEESLAQVVLGFESIIVFLGGLAVYGLNVLPPASRPGGGSSAAPCWRRS